MTRISVNSRTADRLDLFLCGYDGRVYTSGWHAGADWSGVHQRWIDLGGVFPSGSPVAVVGRDPGKLDLFICGKDGRVHTSWWRAGSAWSGLNDRWSNIGGVFPPGAPIAAVARDPGKLDLFICGKDGRVYTSWWSSGGRWSGLGDKWRNLGGVFAPGAPVTAVSRDPGKLDLFICGNDGRVYTSWWSTGSEWSGLGDRWRDLGGVFPARAPIAAVSRDPGKLDLFICGKDGRVYTSWWSAGGEWSGLGDKWRDLGGVFPPGAPVAAVSRDHDKLDLFICGKDGRVYTSWWSTGSEWSGLGDRWRNLGGVFPPGAPVAAVSRDPGKLDLFIGDKDNLVHTSWWSTGSEWSGLGDKWRLIEFTGTAGRTNESNSDGSHGPGSERPEPVPGGPPSEMSNGGDSNGSDPIDPGGEPGCFARGTYVLMADRSARPIEAVRIGDQILTISEHDHRQLVSPAPAVARVTDLLRHDGTYPMLELGGIVATATHRWGIKGSEGDGFLRTDQLAERGVDLRTYDDGRVSWSPAPDPSPLRDTEATVFNLTTSARTYLVSSEVDGPWRLVHNAKKIGDE